MRKKIVSNRYSFLIELANGEKENFFQILCLCKKENSKSAITNLNFIISELLSPTINNTDIDSILRINIIEGAKLFERAVTSFKNKSWVTALEKSLDEDRTLGGWNSSFKI